MYNVYSIQLYSSVNCTQHSTTLHLSTVFTSHYSTEHCSVSSANTARSQKSLPGAGENSSVSLSLLPSPYIQHPTLLPTSYTLHFSLHPTPYTSPYTYSFSLHLLYWQGTAIPVPQPSLGVIGNMGFSSSRTKKSL